jgi:GTP pyrophosphokinase
VAEKGILIVGVDRLLTPAGGLLQAGAAGCHRRLRHARQGGLGASRRLQQLLEHATMHPERVIETTWGRRTDGVFAVDIVIDAHDRQGLLRDVSDVLAREKINVIAVNTQSRQGNAHMRFTAEVGSIPQLNRTLACCTGRGVVGARRA